MIKPPLFNGMLLAAATLMLSGCASSGDGHEDMLARALATQAQILNQQLPVSDNGISLVHASTEKDHRMILEMYQSDNQLNAQTFIDRYSAALCQDGQTRQNLTQGIRYQLVLTTADKHRLQRTVTQCGAA